jgi:Zn-dependent oligopeptidase
MKPQVAENWAKAVSALKDAQHHIEHNESGSAISKAIEAVVFAGEVAKALGLSEIATIGFMDFMRSRNDAPARIVAEAEKTLEFIKDKMPEEYYLP